MTDAFNRGAAKQREVDQAKQKSIAASSSAVNAAEIADRFPSMEEQASSTVSSKQAELAIAQENVKRCYHSMSTPKSLNGRLQSER